MVTLTAQNPTLLDWKEGLDPDGSRAVVIEVLTETNEILMDATFVEGNLPTGHKTTVRTGLPSGTWRKLYGGVQPSKAQRATITETCGMLEAYSECDKALADLGGDTAAFRMDEDRAYIEGLGQDMAEQMFYGNVTVNPERFEGLANRYNSLAAENGDNIIDGGGTGSDNGSIWLVVWGPQTFCGIVPKGSEAGLQVEDKGQVTIENADGEQGRMEGYRTHFRWDAGLALKDWRYVVRIPNIDKSLLSPDASTGANLPRLMFEAINLIPNMGMGRAAFYMSRDTKTKLMQQVENRVSNSSLTFTDVGGHMMTNFQGIPVRRVDRLAIDEARVI